MLIYCISIYNIDTLNIVYNIIILVIHGILVAFLERIHKVPTQCPEYVTEMGSEHLNDSDFTAYIVSFQLHKAVALLNIF